MANLSNLLTYVVSIMYTLMPTPLDIFSSLQLYALCLLASAIIYDTDIR